MFIFKKHTDSDEKRICALCEFSREQDGGFVCGRKKVLPTHSCRKFIYDPLKKKSGKSLARLDDISLEPIE